MSLSTDPPSNTAAARRLGSTPAVDELFARAQDLLPEIAAGSAARERDRVMPYAQVRKIIEAGLVALRVPLAYGGPGATVEDLFGFVIDLAAVDSNIAQALRPGYLVVESLLTDDDERQREVWFPRVLAGSFVGNAGWERGGKNGEIRSTIRPRADHYVVNGTKSYSTGALFADWVTTTAVDDDGNVVWVTVPRDREGLRLLDDWDAAGQRLTASGTTELQDLVVYEEEINRPADAQERERSPVVAVAQLFLGGVLAGIARNALSDAVAYARDHARPIVHSKAERSVEDPYVQHAVGEIAARAYGAEVVVLAAARSIDRAVATTDEERHELLTQAALDVAKAQFVAAESALRAGELLFEVGGASTALKEHNLDRHWRNARTVANHNPRAYKAAAVGAHQLTGEEPPTSGLF
jgi:alkylation response protein AidB-like acyl-CoA dehydrogenase